MKFDNHGKRQSMMEKKVLFDNLFDVLYNNPNMMLKINSQKKFSRKMHHIKYRPRIGHN